MKTGLCIVVFFQAEDGIRDLTVTGVQTCALPISRSWASHRAGRPRACHSARKTGPAGGHPHRTGSTSWQDVEGLVQGGHAVGEDAALDLNDEGRRAVPFRPERVLPRGKLEDAGVRRRRAKAGARELVAPGLDHNAERHRAIAAEDRVADVGDGNGLWPGGAEDVREPARQRGRPNPHRQREPYRRATGSHQERLPARAGYIFGGGHFDSNSVAHTVGQALAPSLIVPIAAPTEAPKFLRTAPPEVTRCLLPCVLRSSPCSSPPASPRPRRRRPSRSPPRT